ncbi:MAG: SufE family protein, partial [Pseudomonadota bacterium]|nr:SufE family protein [Pseudomonadota bacterium]
MPAEPAKTIAEAQESLVESFQFLDDWPARYQYLIELRRQSPPFPETAQVKGNRIHGCQSGVWLVCDYRNGRLEFAATSDLAIVAGIIALRLQVYSGRHPQHVLATTLTFVAEIGFSTRLSSHRA